MFFSCTYPFSFLGGRFISQFQHCHKIITSVIVGKYPESGVNNTALIPSTESDHALISDGGGAGGLCKGQYVDDRVETPYMYVTERVAPYKSGRI